MNSRRDFIRAAGLGAVALTACADDEDKNAPVLETPTERDIRLLNEALDLERVTIKAYDIGLPLLSGAALRAGQRFLAHEHEHAAGLERAIKRLGGQPITPRSDEDVLRQFPNIRRQRDVLRFAVDLENAIIESYLDFLPKLSRPELRRTAAAIVASGGQHISVLLGVLDPGDPAAQVPEAFVTGVASTS